MSKILVTGGAGFIGRHVVKALEADGHILDVVDLQNLRNLRCCRLDYDYTHVVHLAAMGGVTFARKSPGIVIENNVGITRRLACHLRDVPGSRVVMVSSFSVYGDNAAYCDEHTPVDPKETYGASKLMQELCFRGMPYPVTVLRLSSVYGPGMVMDDEEKSTIVAKLANWISKGERPRLFEDGLQTRDFVHVHDVVQVIRRAIEGACPRLLNVCSGLATNLRDACECIGRAYGREKVDYEITGERRPGDMRSCLGHPALVTSVLGRPPISFERGACVAFSAE